MDNITIGTRGSALALWQARWVKSQLESRHEGLRVELVLIKTKGDTILDTALSKVGGKGLFVKEIEEALLRRETDVAVHSMKDVPAEQPEDLVIGAVPEREDLRDVLISRDGKPLEQLPPGARIGTGSLRRQAQLLALRPDLTVVSIRGNVDTRIRKLQTDNLDGIILAAAGMKRMDMSHLVTQYFSPETMLPAIGQGALAIETRRDDRRTLDLISFLKHERTEIGLTAERSFLRTVQGGCQVPIAAWADVAGPVVKLHGLVADLDGRTVIRESMQAPIGQTEALGREVAEKILARGGREILDSLLENQS